MKEILDRVERHNNGYIPNLRCLLACPDTVLEAYQIVSSIPSQQPLTPVERGGANHGSRDQWLCLLCRRSHSLFSIKQIQMNGLLIRAPQNRTKIETDPKLYPS